MGSDTTLRAGFEDFQIFTQQLCTAKIWEKMNTCRQTDRQMGREAEYLQTDRQTDRQTDKERTHRSGVGDSQVIESEAQQV